MDVTELMNRSIVVTTPEESLRRALILLEDSGVRHLPVVSGSRVVGMISDRDVREYRLPILDELDHQKLADDLLARPVSEAMNVDFVFVDEQESVGKAVDVMIEFGVGAVPVVERDTRHLLGMLSYVDILKAVRGTL